MFQSKYRIMIVRDDGHKVKLYPNGNGERALRVALAEKLNRLKPIFRQKLIDRGVGMFRTEAHVAADFDAVFDEVMHTGILEAAVNDVIQDLKNEVMPV